MQIIMSINLDLKGEAGLNLTNLLYLYRIRPPYAFEINTSESSELRINGYY